MAFSPDCNLTSLRSSSVAVEFLYHKKSRRNKAARTVGFYAFLGAFFFEKTLILIKAEAAVYAITNTKTACFCSRAAAFLIHGSILVKFKYFVLPLIPTLIGPS